MKRFKNLLLCLPLVLGALLCAPQASAQQDNQIDTIKKRGKLQVGFGSFVPWAMRDKQGQWVGFEIDVATKVAKDLGVSVELIPTAWDAIIPSLIAGKYDVIIGGLSITPVRQEQIDFTAPYSTSGQGIAASKQLAAKLKWPEDYNSTSVTFACRRGVAGCKTIEEKFPKASLRQFDDDAIAFQEVINGNAHAVISSEPKPAYTILKNPDKLFNPIGDYITTSSEGFGLKKGSSAAVSYFNNWISQNKTWLAQRHSYWFKTQDWATLVP
ncbi:L-cystine-binding protein FliY [Rhodoferax lithotrophicus]|uniref:L-cystine-binding protein FliY n=1 Tax=Rhodoferax lithotrophicus TaxID=2798804 RepID=A0ABN6DC78_9BURK|nr:transporter substrate-binding domain-containing protein [Rhodoferax sp. MIZ03]BCO28411.1 L-cystine-binding protein FliY [Rhodoferax sp. MIZ03]